MLKKNLYILITLIFYSVIISAQKYTINGNVADNQTKTGLAYSNIKVEGTGFGTSTNISGEFKLNLAKGNYLIIASYLGYKSDSVKVELNSDKIINFSLESVQLKLDEVTVRPGRNPAYDIIEKAIAAKEKIKSKISDYSYSAYTKGLIKTTQDFQNSSYSISSKDTGEIKITGIIENESRNLLFKTPDLSKYYIVPKQKIGKRPSVCKRFNGQHTSKFL